MSMHGDKAGQHESGAEGGERGGVGAHDIGVRHGDGQQRLPRALHHPSIPLHIVLHHLDRHQHALPPPCPAASTRAMSARPSLPPKDAATLLL